MKLVCLDVLSAIPTCRRRRRAPGRKLAERYFPAELVHRPKMGFGIPLALWLRGPLGKVLRDTLLDKRLMAPLSGAVIEQTLREFEAGRDGHESRLWALFMFGCWRKQQGEGS